MHLSPRARESCLPPPNRCFEKLGLDASADDSSALLHANPQPNHSKSSSIQTDSRCASRKKHTSPANGIASPHILPSPASVPMSFSLPHAHMVAQPANDSSPHWVFIRLMNRNSTSSCACVCARHGPTGSDRAHGVDVFHAAAAAAAAAAVAGYRPVAGRSSSRPRRCPSKSDRWLG